MSMEIIYDGKKPVLPEIIMDCDKIIHKKLLKYLMIRECFSTSHTLLLCGGTGSGKTSWVLKMLISDCFARVFHDIILMMPEGSFNSINESNNVFKEYLPEENIYFEMDEENLKEIQERIKENSKRKKFTLFICDDYGEKLKDKKIEKQLESIFLKNRHLRCSSWILCQNYYMMSKKVREITNNVILFNTNKSQNEKFFKEMFDKDVKKFKALLNLCKTPHDYLLFNLKYKRIFHDWKEIVFCDENGNDYDDVSEYEIEFPDDMKC